MIDSGETIRKLQSKLLEKLAAEKQRFVPAAVSNRHVHLSEEHICALFGAGRELSPQKPLSQPGQYACMEVVEIRGSKGSIKNVRVLGPARKETQVEISVTDSYGLGIKPVARMSGDLAGTPGCILAGPNGEIKIENGVIVAMRHLHISKEQSAAYGLKDGDSISLQKKGDRAVLLQNIAVRCGDGHELELHIDTDEANAAIIKNGDFLEIV